MRRFAAITCLLLAAVICIGLYALEQHTKAPRVLATVAHLSDVRPELDPYEELIVELPEDGGVWHTTIVYGQSRETDPESRRIAAWFATDPKLRSLVAQTKVHQFTTGDKLYRERYSQQMGGETPQIWLQRSDGKVVYKKAGAKIPSSARDLANAIDLAIEQCPDCPKRPRPRPPAPQPDSPDDVTPDDQPPVIDDVGPDPGAALDLYANLRELPYWLLLVPVLAGFAAYLIVYRK